MSFIPLWEKIVETKNCLISWDEFHITDKDREFYGKISPTFDGRKHDMPNPKLCPDERRRRRLSFYNQRNWYWTTCEVTGEKILSRIHPESGLRVWSIQARSDRWWDTKDYQLDPSYETPFFEQVKRLSRMTPFQNLIWSSSNAKNNSLYTNHTSEMMNNYLIVNANKVSDSS